MAADPVGVVGAVVVAVAVVPVGRLADSCLGGRAAHVRSASSSVSGCAVGAARGRSPSPRACAASRRAQSWNVGQTGNALERQYASWCAAARGDGTSSA